MKKNKKKYIILLLLFIAVGMGIGYSLLQQQLKIQGTATVDDSFAVEITGIERYDYDDAINVGDGGSAGNVTIGTVAEIAKPTFTSTTANFNVRLGYMTSISYLITIKNNGNMEAILKDVSKEITGNTNIEVITPMNIDNILLGSGETFQYIVKLQYKDDDNLTEQSEKESNISITINAEQITSSSTTNNSQPYLTIVDKDGTTDTIVDVINPTTMNGLYYSIDDGEYKELQTSVVDGELLWAQKAITENKSYEKYMISVLGDSLNDGVQHTIKIKAKGIETESNVIESNVITIYYLKNPA